MNQWIQIGKEEAMQLENYVKAAKIQVALTFHLTMSLWLSSMCMMAKSSMSNGIIHYSVTYWWAFDLFWHDEYIFKQFILTSNAWVGPNGDTVAVPKDEGQGLMISAFQSHEFGSGMALDNEQLKEVNRYCEGKFYVDADAALVTRQHKEKGLFTTSPFIQEFVNGKNNEGYCAYQWRVIKFSKHAHK
jgi:hypothetical protein